MKLKKSLGQNFLNDANILRKEVAIGDVKRKTVLEIGAGDGRLTEKILEADPKKIYVVEFDKRFVEVLKNKFKLWINRGKIEIINVDFLELDAMKVDVIMGNIPYYISSSILFKLKEYEFKRAIIIVQKEFAEKIVAKPNEKNYGRLSITAQLAFYAEIVQKVPRHLFLPPPKVDSVMILLKPTETKLTEHEENIIRVLFQHRNQTVRNALSHAALTAPEKFAAKRVRTLIKEDCLEIAKLLNNRIFNFSS